MCQGEGANLSLETDKENDNADGNNRKVKFKIYSVKSQNSFFFTEIFYHAYFVVIFDTFLFHFVSFWCEKTTKTLKKEHLLELFQMAVARQTDIMVMNILGHGVDIPLLGLREACKELNNGELCELFTDESYQISQCFLLSTSQVC